MVPPDDQIFNQSKLCHLLAKFATNASGAIWWSNLQLMQVVSSGGQICNLYKWRHMVAKFATYTSGAILCPKNATNASDAMLLLNLIRSHGVNFWVHVPLAMFQPKALSYLAYASSKLYGFIYY